MVCMFKIDISFIKRLYKIYLIFVRCAAIWPKSGKLFVSLGKDNSIAYFFREIEENLTSLICSSSCKYCTVGTIPDWLQCYFRYE